MAAAEKTADDYRRHIMDRIVGDLDQLPQRAAVAALREWTGWEACARQIVRAELDTGRVVTSEFHASEIAKVEAVSEDFERDVDRLHRLICEGRRQEALDLLRDMAPSHQFLSDAAGLMLAGFGDGAAA